MPTPTVSDDSGNHRVVRNFSERRHRHVSETVRRFSSSCHRPSVDESPAEALDPMEVLMATVNALRAPGPRMNCMAGFRRDHPRMVAQLQREYGDIVRMRIGPYLVHQLSHPDFIRHVLLDNQHNYRRGRFYDGFSAIFGRGLLTTDGDEWRKHRDVSKPVFHPRRIDACSTSMTEAAVELRDRLGARAAEQAAFDLVSESMRYSITALSRSLFGTDLSSAAAEVTPANHAGVELIMQRMNPAQRLLPRWVPTRHNLRLNAATSVFGRILDDVIDEHARRGPSAEGDLVAHHLGLVGQRQSTDTVLTAREARDGLITTFLAGHETTGTSLAWTLYVLSVNPIVRRRLEEEVDKVLGERPATVADLPALPYTRMVVQESLRLYPPIWIYPRDVIEDDEIGGYVLPAGSSIFISPYATHRHPGLWENPEAFDPERFTEERSAGRPRHAYFPFGFGQRQCIGKQIALMQLQIAVATVARSVHLHPLPGQPITYQAKPALVSLRPTQGPRSSLLFTAHDRRRAAA
jgi:cytochrome P450